MASVVVEVASWWLEFEEGVVVVMRAFFGCGGEVIAVVRRPWLRLRVSNPNPNHKSSMPTKGKDLVERLSSYVMLMGT